SIQAKIRNLQKPCHLRLQCVSNLNIRKSQEAAIIDCSCRGLPIIGRSPVGDTRIQSVRIRIVHRPSIQSLHEKIAFAHALVKRNIGTPQGVRYPVLATKDHPEVNPVPIYLKSESIVYRRKIGITNRDFIINRNNTVSVYIQKLNIARSYCTKGLAWTITYFVLILKQT